MSEREQVKELIFKEFPNGWSHKVSGYCTYILKNKEGIYKIEYLTSGMFLNKGELAVPPKYYDTPEEMFNDIKLYFNPKEA